MNSIHGVWLHDLAYTCSAFTDLDGFHCLDNTDCEYCCHCLLTDRYEYQRQNFNTIWRSCWLCSMPSVRKNYDSCKEFLI